jgi:cellobiose-specific phosphotransferase system component IIC
VIGVVPIFAVLNYQYAANGGVADAMFTGNSFQWFMYAGGFGALWAIVLIFQIAQKSDPVYDRLAGTAVVRD